MGRGLVRLLLGSGHEVVLSDADPEVLDRVGVELAEIPGHGGLLVTLDWQAHADRVDLAIECASESESVKAAVLAGMDRCLPADCVIASNTSSFTPSELAGFVCRPARLLCLHFFNPPDVVRLVEVAGHPGTDPALMEWAQGWVDSFGGRPIVMREQRRGLVANRLQAAVLVEAIVLVGEGVVTAAELDDIVVTSIGPRWAAVGPLTVADLGGLDIFAALIGRIGPTLASSQVALAHLSTMLAEGRAGAKTGSGFAAYADGARAQRDRIAHTISLLSDL